MKRKLNYKFAKKDPRDPKYAREFLRFTKALELPESTDLTPTSPAIYDQGDQGSCTANAAAFHKQFLNMRYKIDWEPSRDFIYKCELISQGTPNEDAGSDLRTSCQVIQDKGACHENFYPYSDSVFQTNPSEAAYADGAKHKIQTYYRLRTLTDMKHCLASGYPFVFGMIVPNQLMNYSSGIIRDLVSSDVLIEDGQPAGHALACVGYNDNEQYFIIRNSWGADWGCNGYFCLGYDVMTDPSWVSDCYTMRLAHQPEF